MHEPANLMALADDLKAAVKKTFANAWTTRDGTIVPEADSIKLANDAVKMHGVVLYADIAESTGMVDSYKSEFAAEVYKAYLHCAAKVITSEGGVITAYDGDRIMSVYIGDSKNSAAAKTALKLNYARLKIVQPALETQYPDIAFKLQQVVGVDRSELFVARTGVRGANDLVGRASGEPCCQNVVAAPRVSVVHQQGRVRHAKRFDEVR